MGYLRCFSPLLTRLQLNTVSKTAVCIFFQTGTDMELLCKASTVVFESLGCRKALKGIYLNLLHIVTKSTDLKVRQRRSPQGTEPPESPHPLPLPFPGHLRQALCCVPGCCFPAAGL